MHLIVNWKDAWRWMSIRMIALAAGLQLTLLAFPAQLSQYLPPWLLQATAIACLAGAALGRVTQRTKPDVPAPTDPPH